MSAINGRLLTGGLIDRGRLLRFTFDGRGYTGFEGDTLASALLANGVRLVGRSFKYHRPRGILTAGGEEPNALVTHRVGAHADPNTRATTLQLYDGLIATSQNRWPSLSCDLMAINQLASPILGAGFYYKTFMWPAAFWEKLYEPLIRRAAGLGKLSGLPDPDIYDREHIFCDLLVIGGGPAGLGAALAAARSGAHVLLVEDDWCLGGRLLGERHEIDGANGVSWAEAVERELASIPNVTILTRASVFGVYDGEYAALERLTDHLPISAAGAPRQRYWKIIARRAVLATGAIERPLVFGDNDRPGVMMASAVSTYINRFGVKPASRVAVFTTADSGWRTVDDLLQAGMGVAAVIDARPGRASTHMQSSVAAGVPVISGAVVIGVRGSPVRSVIVRDAAGQQREIVADALAMAGGWNPAVGLGCNLGARPEWSEEIASYVLRRPPSAMTIVGAAAGNFRLEQCLKDGIQTGTAIARDLGFQAAQMAVPATSDDEDRVSPLWRVAESRGKAFVDFQNDVTDRDIAQAAREGFVSVEHMKRYTTLGMATDQGKNSQVNGNAILAVETGKSIAATGTVLSRPPFVPVAIAAFAGHHREEEFRPVRLTASHDWAVALGATFVDAGAWKRAQWYARPGDVDWLATVSREVLATRTGVGICDVSTLGKIEVHGPDAAAFLDRLYANSIATLPVGKVRYGLMLREDGIVMDDGTVTRFAPELFFVTTTTANAVKVMQHIDYCRQVTWPGLDVQALSVTEQWAQFSVAGPRSRALLQALLPDVDLTNEALPYMAAVRFCWRGVRARLYRVSFSGELAYEIGVPANYGDALVRTLMEVGAPLGVTPYGTEALSVMRIEKGHAAGNELNGETTAADLGLARLMSTKKDFIGRVMAGRPGLSDPSRPALVGLRAVDRRAQFSGGAHLLPRGFATTADADEGYVTSVAFSPNVDQWIGLGLLRNGPRRLGERVRAYDPVRNRDTMVEVCSPIFIDPEGSCLRA